MAKNDNAQSLRLVDSIRKHAGDTLAQEMEACYPLSKSAAFDKKYEWAQHACSFLENHLDEATILRIRKECRCNDGKAIAKKLLRYLHQTETIAQFVQAFNAKETFASLEYVSEHQLVFCYPACYCACVKHVPQPLSKTWCLCTLGNAEGIFTEVFKTEVKVSLLESIKTGGSKCRIAVEWA